MCIAKRDVRFTPKRYGQSQNKIPVLNDVVTYETAEGRNGKPKAINARLVDADG
jgi:hypothetical protein